MKLTDAMAKDLLLARDNAFMAADLDAYMKLWSEEGCIIEMGSMRFSGSKNIRDTLTFAWSMLKALHMETRSFAVNDRLILNEFAIVWLNKKTGERTLQTGMGVLEVNDACQFISLRDYLEPADAKRNSALELPAIKQLMNQ
ncbi:MAG TPA: nuclear transport factor 2 family protein [Pseudomonadales bacterium]|nr:nuclear transport factor 2 family protein [Pseudomonadales bacterium]